MRYPTFAALCLVLGIGSSAEASKTVYMVGPAPGIGIDFTQIQPAIDSAGDGDVILVKSGVYESFFVNNKALTIQADRGEVVTVKSRGTNAVEIVNLKTDSTTVLRRLIIDAQAAYPVVVAGCAGPVWIEDCNITARPSETFANFPKPAVYAHNSAAFLLSRTTIVGSGATLGPSGQIISAGAGLGGFDSYIHLYQTTVFGGPAALLNGMVEPGGAAVEMSGGLMFAGRSELHGGAAYFNNIPTSQCIGALGGGYAIWLKDLEPEVNLLDTQLFTDSAAFGQCGGGLPTTPHKIDTGTITVLPGFTRLIKVDSIVKAAAPVSLTFEGKPGDLAVIAYSMESIAYYTPLAKGTVFVKVPYPIIVLGQIPPNGKLPIDVNVPALPPGSDALRLYFQGAFYNGSSVAYVTNPSAVTIVK